MARKSWMTRAAGVLLPVSSLPSKYGVGTFGQAARDWVDFLARAKQRYWQVLPLGPTSFGDSPYQSYSAFAGNPLFIDLQELCKEGLLKRAGANALPGGRTLPMWITMWSAQDGNGFSTRLLTISQIPSPWSVSASGIKLGWRTTPCIWPLNPRWTASPGQSGKKVCACGTRKF